MGKTPKRDKHHPPHFPRFPVGRRGTPNWDRTSLTILHPSAIPKLFPPIFPLSESSILRISLRGPMGNHCASANFWMLKKAPPGTCRVPPHNEDRAGGVGRYPPARSPTPGKPPGSVTRQEVEKAFPTIVTCAGGRSSSQPSEPRCPRDGSRGKSFGAILENRFRKCGADYGQPSPTQDSIYPDCPAQTPPPSPTVKVRPGQALSVSQGRTEG